MAKITWDDTGKRLYETGVDHGVLYPYGSAEAPYATGVDRKSTRLNSSHTS